MTLLSIVVPIRSMGGALRPLFEWVKEALLLNCQIVLVHDYFDEQTEKELINFVRAQKSNNLLYVSSIFNSPGLARNAGIDLTVGEFVAFWDADDLPEVSRAVSMALRCHNDRYEIGIGGFQTIVPGSTIAKEYPTTFQSNLNKIALYPGVWRMVFKSSILENVRYENLLLAEDQLFLATVAPTKKKVLFDNEIIYSYSLQREGSLTTKRTNISDLNQAIDGFFNLIDGDASRARTRFNLILIIKNSLTVLKMGSFKQQIRALSSFGRILSRYPVQMLQIFIEIISFKASERKL